VSTSRRLADANRTMSGDEVVDLPHDLERLAPIYRGDIRWAESSDFTGPHPPVAKAGVVVGEFCFVVELVGGVMHRYVRTDTQGHPAQGHWRDASGTRLVEVGSFECKRLGHVPMLPRVVRPGGEGTTDYTDDTDEDSVDGGGNVVSVSVGVEDSGTVNK